ncbi:MAG: aminoacetone oxidase family FAD-binding enzyme [Phycisphaerales bacterium]|nr:MAG: aminoacetone oxidase family FAD-binding enzyme [Phycisphaerales bacterium]
MDQADIAIVGAGAAGLMAAIHAGRRARELNRPIRIVALDGARTLGAKILVAGGGRCNVTHHAVTPDAYAGSTRNAIKKVLRRFDVPDTVAFFQALGVELKREDTGKLFPTTDSARTVLNALLQGVRDTGAEIHHPRRVETIQPIDHAYTLAGDWGELTANRLILATGGMALPRSGSDGAGYAFAKALGHTVTPRVFPALVPLIVEPDHFIRHLSGLTLPARLELRAGTGKRLLSFTNSTLCTHFGLSGPSTMDLSRYLTSARHQDRAAHLVIAWLPDATPDQLDADLQALNKRGVVRWLSEHLPARLAETLCAQAEIEPQTLGHALTRDQRKRLVRLITECPVPVTGDRGFTHAETTAGGVPLAEIELGTMTSRVRPNLHLCGEICDVDGRIGGFNFQWAWASGHIAGLSAADARCR